MEGIEGIVLRSKPAEIEVIEAPAETVIPLDMIVGKHTPWIMMHGKFLWIGVPNPVIYEVMSFDPDLVALRLRRRD